LSVGAKTLPKLSIFGALFIRTKRGFGGKFPPRGFYRIIRSVLASAVGNISGYSLLTFCMYLPVDLKSFAHKSDLFVIWILTSYLMFLNESQT
jgi:hypothetical protein